MEDITLAGLISPATLRVIKEAGLHRVVGAMEGVDELGLKEAVCLIGARAYAQRIENAKIAQGLADLAALTGEK